MKIRYIAHSGYAILGEKYNILFDYYRGEMPNFDKDKPLFVFASHRHFDHFVAEIFTLNERIDKLVYILSDDIDIKKVPSEILPKVVFLKAKEEKCIKIDDIELEIYTYKSTDEGLAFIIDIGYKRIYYAGDLNYWYWSGESDIWNEKQEKDYTRQLTLMSELLKDGKSIDVAFIPLDNRQEDFAYLGIEYFLRLVDAKKIFPMHFNGGFDIISKLKDRLSKEDGLKIVDIVKENEEFIL